MSEKIIKLEPIFKEVVWGGSRMRTEYGYDIPGDDTGEAWIGAHANGDSKVADGEYAGSLLSDLWNDHPQLFGLDDTKGVKFPLLVKIIDANNDLSIQVHPDDIYAGEHENGSLGKMECWYILDAAEGATLVVGHNAKTHEELVDMIEGGKWDSFIRQVPVRKGDFIQIDPGTVHAIKGGILLLETQQNSDITYRVYDYNRMVDGKPRQLHVQQSIDVITVPAANVEDSIRNYAKTPVNELVCMNECKRYKVWKIDVDVHASIKPDARYLFLSVVEGSGSILGTDVQKGDHFLIPAGFDTIDIDGNMTVICSTDNH